MDENDFEEFLNDLGQEEAEPTYRATYRRDRLTVLRWWAGLVDNGPATTFFAHRERAGAVIADLTVHEDSDGNQLAVVYRSAGRVLAGAEEAIKMWAEAVGFTRVWFPDYVVELEPVAGPSDKASVKCGTCGQSWSASGQSFWSGVVEGKGFPAFCPLCGGDLPAWRVERENSSAASGPQPENADSSLTLPLRGRPEAN